MKQYCIAAIFFQILMFPLAQLHTKSYQRKVLIRKIVINVIHFLKASIDELRINQKLFFLPYRCYCYITQRAWVPYFILFQCHAIFGQSNQLVCKVYHRFISCVSKIQRILFYIFFTHFLQLFLNSKT